MAPRFSFRCRYHGLPTDHPDATCALCEAMYDNAATQTALEAERTALYEQRYRTARGWQIPLVAEDEAIATAAAARGGCLSRMVLAEQCEQRDPQQFKSIHPVLVEEWARKIGTTFAAEWEAWVWWIHPKTSEGIPTNLNDPHLVY